jgi:hypothetical protein
LAAAAVLLGLGASGAKADNIVFNPHRLTFTYNTFQPWRALGENNTDVANGTTVTSVGGVVSTTITFRRGGPGQSLQEGSTWDGNFSAGQTVLASLNTAGQSQGAITLDFSQGVAGVGLQIQSLTSGIFHAEIEGFDGSTPLGTFFAQGDSTNANNNSAIFLGFQDLTAPDITSITVLTFGCAGGCDGFAINRLLFETQTTTTTPEPASLALLGSGLLALGLLRRKLRQS